MPLSECTHAGASLARALHIIESTSLCSYVVGGFVRDRLLGRPSRDIDVIVDGDPLVIAREIARTLAGSCVSLDEERGIARVVVAPPMHAESDALASGTDALVLDLARHKGDIADDLARRDFTIDAIAVPAAIVASLLTEEGDSAASTIARNAIDPLGGLTDLTSRVLKHAGKNAFENDPGRLMRAVRLARELDFTIDWVTEELIVKNASLASRVAAERTREELLALLSLPRAADSIHYLDRLGLMTVVVPELEDCRDVEQPTCHFWDVLEHSIQTVATFEFIAGEADWRFGNDEMLEYFPEEAGFEAYLSDTVSTGVSKATLIKLACLLHDLAKPQTRELDESGRARFLGHARYGAALAKGVLQRLRFSTHETTYVETLIYNHLRPAQMSAEGPPTARAVYRFFRDTAGAGFGVLYLAVADYLACKGPLFTTNEWRAVCNLVQFILREHQRQEEAVSTVKLIDGRELMRAVGLEPGPIVGILLETIREAHAAGLVSTREEALQLARKTMRDEHFTVRTSR